MLNRSSYCDTLFSGFLTSGRGVKGWGLFLAVLALTLAHNPVVAAEVNELIRFDIPQQRADAALTSFAQQADITVIFRHDLAKQHQANQLVGKYVLSEAAELLLKDSGLRAIFDEQGYLTIVEATGQEAEVKTSSKKTSFVVAALASIFSISTNGQTTADNNSGDAERKNVIEEVLVTATKRAESVQDIPASITALNQLEIERRGLVSMDDYLSTIPGVNMADRGVSSNKIIIRGVNASIEEDSTVGIFFGEVPLNTVARGSTADLKMVDVNRVEVLRGPQGTLFGSGSMGGAIRNIPNAPNLEQIEGKVEIGFSNTSDSGSENYNLAGVVNVPLVKDTLAIRLVGYNYNYSGYVDNIGADDPELVELADFYGATVVNKYGVGGAEYSGARASVLWTPTDKLSFTLMYASQELDQDGETEVNLSKGGYANIPWQIGNINGGDEQKLSDLDLANLVIEYDFEWASLLSSTSSLDHDTLEAEDLSKDFGGLPAAQTREHLRESFVQEVRMTSQWQGPLQMIAGIYYEDLEQNILSEVPWTGDPAMITETPFGDFLGTDPNDLYHQDDLFTIEQTALFGEMSYQINEQFSGLIGARWFDYERHKIENQTGVFSGGGLFSNQTIEESDTSFKANVSYTPNDNTLIYAQWAEGFRVGQPVTPAPSFCDSVDGNGNPGSDGLLDGTNIPIESDSVESDTLDSYEIGGKFTALDDRFQANASIYYIDWNGIPVSVFAVPHCGFGVTVNAGKATIQGAELETTYYVSDNVRLEVGLAYTDAELAEDSSLGPEGTRLPGSSKFKGNLGLQYEFQLAQRPSFARLNYAYVGGYQDSISSNVTESGDYSKLDLRAGIDLNSVELEIYATNALNEDAVTHVLSDPVIAYQLRPRTIGFDMRYRF
jgi:iron complex outermembrane receptor protein